LKSTSREGSGGDFEKGETKRGEGLTIKIKVRGGEKDGLGKVSGVGTLINKKRKTGGSWGVEGGRTRSKKMEGKMKGHEAGIRDAR